MKPTKIISLATALMFLTVGLAHSQTLTQFGPDSFVKIEEGSGGFFASLDAGDRFSRDHDKAGDINGDGIIDLVVGARSDDDGETDAGAVYILFMNNDGTVQSNQKISALEGGFDETLTERNYFGYGVAGIGDYDGDEIPDIAVSAPTTPNNSLYIIHLNSDGTVKNYVKNSNITAQGLSAIGDLNNDGRIDLAACDPSSDSGGNSRGAISLLFLDNESQVIPSSTVTISTTSGGFGTGLEDGDMFGGREVAMLGDIDNDGTLEIAVAAFMSDGGKGAVWMLSLDPTTYNVVSKLKITEGMNGFSDELTTSENPNGTFGAQFGHALCAPGDLNGDGIPDLITGANQQNKGDAYILYLNDDKTVKTYTKINETEGGLDFTFGDGERFSRSISFVGDLRGNGTIAVNFGGGVSAGGTGTLYLVFFKPCNFTEEPGYYRWTGGNTLFTNWTHSSQTVSGDPLTLEQCALKSFETNASYITYNHNDGRCICIDADATLVESTELSTAYFRDCDNSIVPLNTDKQTENLFAIYPNPTASDIVLTTTEVSFSESDQVRLYNVTGELLYTSNIRGQQTKVDLSAYPNGVYYLYANIQGVFKTLKVLKE